MSIFVRNSNWNLQFGTPFSVYKKHPHTDTPNQSNPLHSSLSPVNLVFAYYS